MIYLDHAAATPVIKKAQAAMEPYLAELFFNPSAPYLPANRVRDAYEQAKDDIAHTIGAKGADLIITSGATEANNLAFTVYDAILHNESQRELEPTEILVLETEHASVKAAATATKMHCVEIKVDKTGRIDLDDFKKKLSSGTILVSVSLVNNELGTIQPLADIAAIMNEERIRRCQNGSFKPLPLYLHSDASQALTTLDVNVARLGVDLLTISSAKIGGPKGVGALYAGHDVKLWPLINGGGQEQNLRSGTENVPGVIGFATAAKEAKEHVNGNRKKYDHLAALLRTELEQSPVPPLFLHNKKHHSSNFVPVSFKGIDAERLIYKLEDKEVYLSTGAACAASKGTKSHVLTAIGLTDEEIAGSLRISLGPLNTEENVKEAGRLIRAAVAEELERQSRDV